MNVHIQDIVLIAAAYALGCVSTGYYLVRFRSGGDVRRVGSGNIGARNVGRALGKRALAITLVGDAAKGAIPVAGARLLGLDGWALVAVTFAVVIGHVWPAQLGFRGGKGLATTMGAVIALDFRLVLGAFVIASIAWVMSRKATASGLVAVALTPVLAAVMGLAHLTVISLFILAALIMFTHRANLQAIFADETTASGEGV